MPDNGVITLPDGSTRPLNFRPSQPDVRNHLWHPPMGGPPFQLDPGPFGNEQYCPDPDDQGAQGCCSADGSTGLYEFTAKAHGQTVTDLSRAYVYARARQRDGTPLAVDGGSYPHTVADVLHNLGACREELMPYNPASWTQAPTAAHDADAANHQLLQYAVPARSQADMTAMFRMRQGMIGGFPVYQSFESPQAMQTGFIPVPQPGEKLLGYHLVFFYDCDSQWVWFQNSWGKGIGVNGSGRFRMPWQLILNPQFFVDPWTFVTVEADVVPQPAPPDPDELAKLYDDIIRIMGPINGVDISFAHGQRWPLAIQAPAIAQLVAARRPQEPRL